MFGHFLSGGFHLMQAAGSAPALQDQLAKPLVTAVIFTGIGLVLFALAFVIMAKVAPFCIRKEIEEDQNISLGILMGSVIIGIAIIVAAAIHG